MPLLHNGASFPEIRVSAVGGGFLSLPEDCLGSYAAIVIYRGAWCPFCGVQLAEFAAEGDALAALGVKVVAFSVDDEAASAAFMAKHNLRFPVGYGADAEAVAEATGAFLNEDPHCLQATGFIIAPNGSVLTAVYSTRAIGRLTAPDVLRFVSFIKAKVAAQAKAAQ